MEPQYLFIYLFLESGDLPALRKEKHCFPPPLPPLQNMQMGKVKTWLKYWTTTAHSTKNVCLCLFLPWGLEFQEDQGVLDIIVFDCAPSQTPQGSRWCNVRWSEIRTAVTRPSLTTTSNAWPCDTHARQTVSNSWVKPHKHTMDAD